eukprot:scaffold1808_cov158-Amphora_coffeaeformis.AAC.11
MDALIPAIKCETSDKLSIQTASIQIIMGIKPPIHASDSILVDRGKRVVEGFDENQRWQQSIGRPHCGDFITLFPYCFISIFRNQIQDIENGMLSDASNGRISLTQG